MLMLKVEINLIMQLLVLSTRMLSLAMLCCTGGVILREFLKNLTLRYINAYGIVHLFTNISFGPVPIFFLSDLYPYK